mmetsp:Transcript_117485/g.184766  ORF Transcript_117485/g.184766 Transcript_117485/m.184766 type:complete len:193 (-) Transcript_117485:8-586(-)
MQLSALAAVVASVGWANAYVVGRSRQVTCPMDFDVPLPDGQPSQLHLNSVANFLSPKVQDRWWTTDHVQMYYDPSHAKYRLGRSKIAGCGVIAKDRIRKGEKIGIVWVKDELSLKGGPFADMIPRHFTPWYGRAVNHCPTHANSGLWEDVDGVVYSVAKRDIEPDEEVTGDYGEAAAQFPHLVENAPAGWTC